MNDVFVIFRLSSLLCSSITGSLNPEFYHTTLCLQQHWYKCRSINSRKINQLTAVEKSQSGHRLTALYSTRCTDNVAQGCSAIEDMCRNLGNLWTVTAQFTIDHYMMRLQFVSIFWHIECYQLCIKNNKGEEICGGRTLRRDDIIFNVLGPKTVKLVSPTKHAW